MFIDEALVAKVTNQANRIPGMIRRSYEDKSVKNIVQLYTFLVRPRLEYAVQAWRPYKKKYVDQIEKVQRQATRIIRHLYSLLYDQDLEKNKYSLPGNEKAKS